MLIIRGPWSFPLCRGPSGSRILTCRRYATKSYDPLRILFCGSDEFSIASLKALHAYHLMQPDRITSIDVVCRPGKRVGRGLKTIREVPIKEAASALSLPIHEIDTFKGWTPPVPANGPVNLIVAVSFGLFVPSRILNSAKYGGLNVHPSLLPDFRGPAPLHHTLLAGRRKTGVTLQTLHPKHFDHGTILSQTSAPGFDIPNPNSCTVAELQDIVTPLAAQLLLKGIHDGLFVAPLEDAGVWLAEGHDKLIHAPKIKPEDRHLDWANWTSLDINRRHRVLGPLWNRALAESRLPTGPQYQHMRVILTETEEVEPPEGCDSFSLVPGLPFVPGAHPVVPKRWKALYVFTSDGKVLRINKMKVEGDQAADGLRAAVKFRMFADRTFQSGGLQFTPFRNPLI